MVALTSDALAPEPQPNSTFRVDWELVAAIFGAALMVGLALAAANGPKLDAYLPREIQHRLAYGAFAFAALVPVLFSWRRAISDGKLAAAVGEEPRYEHVSGWSALMLVGVMVGIAILVLWAANSDVANRRIHAELGMWVVIALSIAFIVVAAAPLFPRVVRLIGLGDIGGKISTGLNVPIDWIGGGLSAADGFLVFAVANGAGTNFKGFFLRYAILLSAIVTCAVLGYYWPAPWAFVPLAWGFVVAFSVSRRWDWIEQDRELAMLNPTLSQQHIRVGFSQNLRDEALVVFLSMFLLVPLALRQAQLLAGDMQVQLFTLSEGADVHSLTLWIAFYGTELAKAVPFVDWAEVYHVEGDAPLRAITPLALHAVFAMRVLIDLVFLAALLQAISAASREAQQKDLFYRKRAIRRLDPFTEPEAFRALVRRGASGGWEPNGSRFDEFPVYDPNRLVELAASSDERICRAADLLLERDDIGADPHHRLSTRAASREATPEEINALLDEIENAGPHRNIYQLALARRRLLSKRSMADVRRRIVSLIARDYEPSDRAERTSRLLEAMIGEQRESYQQARRIALEALAVDVGINLSIRNALAQVAAHDGATAMRRQAAEILARHPETPD